MRIYIFHLNTNFYGHLNAYRMEKTFNYQVDQMIMLVYASHLHSLLCVGPAKFRGGNLSKRSNTELNLLKNIV